MLKRLKFIPSVLMTIFYGGLLSASLFAAGSSIDPSRIEVLGLVSRGEDGAAWVKVNGKETLVSPGFTFGKDLKVTAVKHDGVIFYQPDSLKYHSIAPQVPDTFKHHVKPVIWCMPMPLWKAVRMIALAFRKEYICHFETLMGIAPRNHVVSMEEMLEKCVTPNHRFHGRDGIIYVAPVHVRNTGWTWFNEQVKIFKSKRLIMWFPSLAEKGTLISNGREMADVLHDIEGRTKVLIRWERPLPMPLYCSFKDRPWHEILENILLFNGLSILPLQNELVVTQGWE